MFICVCVYVLVKAIDKANGGVNLNRQICLEAVCIFFVTLWFLQLFCKFKVISKQKKKFFLKLYLASPPLSLGI